MTPNLMGAVLRTLTSPMAHVRRMNPHWDEESPSLMLTVVRGEYGYYMREHYEPIEDEV